MKRILVGIAVLCAALGPVACDEGGPTGPGAEPSADVLVSSPVELTLAMGEETRLGEGPLRLVFRRVVEDSRCPVGVVCVWEGNAVVELGVAVGTGPPTPLQFNSTLEPRSATWNGLVLTYLELLPRPRVESPEPDYTLRVRVEATGG